MTTPDETPEQEAARLALYSAARRYAATHLVRCYSDCVERSALHAAALAYAEACRPTTKRRKRA